MDKYSIEEIEEAIDSVYSFVSCTDLTDKLIAALQRPKFQPEVGQVYAYYKNSERYIARRDENHKLSEIVADRHPLTLTEHGPDVRAYVEGMKRLADDRNFPINISDRDDDDPVYSLEVQEDARIEFAAQILKDHPIED